jgi:CRISPR-associated endonuclease/helicase Cas3
MRWMGRFFLRLTEENCTRLVDLPTGAGKTDVVVIWVLALAWYGLETGTRTPVPRRLVWVVNRRVLVQQVFRLAEGLEKKLSSDGTTPGSLAQVREGLARLSGDGTDIFRVVQLRGQLIDDREWSVAPSVPQLIIGTVDQIGSRLLFQGYGLGKGSRPLQAALLGIDPGSAWMKLTSCRHLCSRSGNSVV